MIRAGRSFVTRCPFGLQVFSSPVSCVCVYLCVCQLLLVRTINHLMSQLESPDLDEKMQNILFKVPIVLGADWAWPSMSNLTSFQNYVFFCIAFASLIYLWDVQKQSLLNYSTSHMAPHTFWFLYKHADRVVPWTVKQSSNKSLWEHGSPASLRLGDWQWILQISVGFRQIICTSHTNIIYYNIGNHWNNCKTAFIQNSVQSTSCVKSRDTHVTVQCVQLSSASFQSFITSKFVEIPDNMVVYKLINVHDIDLLTNHAESKEEEWQATTETL